MSFILKTVRDRHFGQILDPLVTKDYSSRTFEKFRLFRISVTILNFDGNEKVILRYLR